MFLYYVFNSPYGFHILDTIRRHVAVAGVTGTDLEELEIPYPKLPEQRKIASFLNDLDMKIELNLKILKNLEETTKNIFKKWFNNFEFEDKRNSKN